MFRKRVPLLLVGWIALTLSAVSGAVPAARSGLWVANGPVYAADASYDFTTGGLFDTATGQFRDGFPLIEGDVNAVVSDGVGGWYLGGDITAVAAAATLPLVHIDAGGNLDAAWTPEINTTVHALALDGANDRLYVGTDDGLLRLEASSGLLIGSLASNGTVRTLQLAGTALYVGGSFTVLGGADRAYLASVNTADGALLAWNPGADASVRAMTLSGSILYVGGDFALAGGAARGRLAALDTTTDIDNALPWDPQADGAVYALQLDGSAIYVAGDFATLQTGAVQRPRLARLDLVTGAPDAWVPAVPNRRVRALSLSGGGTILYAGGQFQRVGDQVRSHFAVFSTADASLQAVVPEAGLNDVRALRMAGSELLVAGQLAVHGQLYIGGDFSYVGPATGSAAVLDASLQFQPAFPIVDGPVHAAVADGSGGWYIGGAFSRVGGVPRDNLAHVLDAAGTVDSGWNPGSAGVPVHALALSGGVVYAGRDDGLQALDGSSGSVLWSQAADGAIRALTVAGANLYAGGDFALLGGGARARLAALDTATGALQAWNPGADASVRALAVSGSTLYVGGDFTVVGGAVRNRLAALDTGTAALQTWNPDADGPVHALALDGAGLYVGGEFSAFQGGTVARRYLAQLNLTDGSPLAWAPQPDGHVHALTLAGTSLYAGGVFTEVAAVQRHHLAAFLSSDGSVLPAWQPTAGGDVTALSEGVGGALFIGGDQGSVGGVARGNLASLDLVTGAAHSWNPVSDGVVRALEVDTANGLVFAGGQFTAVGGQYRTAVAALDAVSGLATNWNARAGAGSDVHALQLSGEGTLFVGGAFADIGGGVHGNLAELSLSNGNAGILALDADAPVRAIAMSAGRVFVGGDFQGIDGLARLRLASFSLADRKLDDWSVAVDGAVHSLALAADGGTLYLGGDFQVVGGDNHGRLARVATADGTVSPWSADTDAVVSALALAADRTTLYIGGGFTQVGGTSRSGLAAIAVSDGTVLTAASWAPAADQAADHFVLSADGTQLYAGGQFRRLDGTIRPHLAQLPLLPVEAQAPQSSASLPSGNYNSLTLEPVALSCDDGAGSGCAAIYYTLDGSDPVPGVLGAAYAEPITLAKSGTVKFLAVDHVGNVETQVHSETYTIEADPPVTTASPGTMVENGREVVVTLSCDDGDGGSGCVATYYTLDGSTPTMASPRYQGPIRIDKTTVLRFFSVDGAGNPEAVQRERYVINYGGFGFVGIGPLLVLLLWAGLRAGRRVLVGRAALLRLLSLLLLAATGLTSLPPASADTVPEAPNVLFDGPVYTTLVYRNVLYVGGDFSNVSFLVQGNSGPEISSLPLRSLVAIDLGSRSLLQNWAPTSGVTDSLVINALAVDELAGRLIVGGSFSTFAGEARNGLAAITIDTAAVATWDPSQGITSPALTVYDLATSFDGRTLYVAGDFTAIAGQARSHLTALELSTGQLTAWDPRPDAAVRVIRRAADNVHLYAGGDFSRIGGQLRARLAELSLVNAQASAWDPAIVGTSVQALLLQDTTLYAGGVFSGAGGQLRNNLASLDTTLDTANALSWDPNVNGAVYALALLPGNTRVVLGGQFSTVGGVAHDNLAMVDVVAAAVQPWSPVTAGPVRTLMARRMNWVQSNNPNPSSNIQYDYVQAGVQNTHTVAGQSVTSYLSDYVMEPPQSSATPQAGGYQTAQNVALDCLDHNDQPCAAIYYSVDGSEPATIYSGAIPVATTTTIKYYGLDAEGVRESLHVDEYAIDVDAPQTQASVDSGTYGVKNYRPITLTCTDVGDAGCAATYYTLDGSDPTTASTLYSGPVELSGDTTFTLKFISVDNAGNVETYAPSTNSRDYVIDLEPPQVIVSSGGGVYTGPVTITLSCADCVQIYYTLDGTPAYDAATLQDVEPQPSASAILYTGPFLIDQALMMRLLSYDDVGNATYGIGGVYTFIDARPVQHSGVGAVDGGLLLLLAAAALRLCRRRPGAP